MPTTAAAALVLVIAMVPGALGSYFYGAINGLDWRTTTADTAIRYAAFSVVGLAIYAVVASWWGWPAPAQVVPGTYTATAFSAATIPQIAVPFIGHIFVSGLVGVLAAFGARLVAKVTSTTSTPAAWDHFVRQNLPKHWCVVTLCSGDVVAGWVEVADFGVQASDRDVVLAEPAYLQADTKKYKVSNYQRLFLPASMIDSIATFRVKDDTRTKLPDQSLFPSEGSNE